MQSASFQNLSAGNAAAICPPRYPVCSVRNKELDRLSDADLITRCARNDESASEALVTRHARFIYSVAYGLARNHDDASDLASETSIRIHRHIAGFRHAVTLPAWIKRIVRNAYFDMIRASARRPAVSMETVFEQEGDTLMSDDHRTDRSPHHLAEIGERSRILQSAINSLSPTHREMVTLYHTNESTYEEISEQLRIPVGTVKSRLNRARGCLREKLQAHMSVLVC
jgi:RNA polymerase sigma-70 factor, ECF subfamily